MLWAMSVRPRSLVTFAIVTVSLAGALAPAARATTAGARPNILLIVTDDQRWDTLWSMPNVQTDLMDHGKTFANMFVTNSLCCPSRASILTGDFSHTTGVYRNEPPWGAFPSFRDSSTLATWLHGGGYRTALFGKYIDAYQSAGLSGYVPPGWDQWEAFIHAGFYDYQLSMNGAVSKYGSAPQDYSTNVLGNDAANYIRSAPTSQPLFVYWAPEAPHAPATPEAQYMDRYKDLPPWEVPSVNEPDTSDKPAYIRRITLYDHARLVGEQTFRRNQYRTLVSVDQQVGNFVAALADTGRLSNTMILFTSDNGLLWGEHRWSKKEVPYDESLRVPLVVRYDPLTSGRTRDTRLVLNADLAPTIADLAGVAHPPTDGMSLLPILRGDAVSWREDFVLEHM